MGRDLRSAEVSSQAPVRPRGRTRTNGPGSVHRRADGLLVGAITRADVLRERFWARSRTQVGLRLMSALHGGDQGYVTRRAIKGRG